MRIVVISGLSGAGKTIAMHALEDLGYYCVDNLPLGLLPEFVAELRRTGGEETDYVAVAIDARNPVSAFERFTDLIDAVRSQGVSSEVVFLEADDAVLTKRFRETRRKHPLTNDSVSLGEALRHERQVLQPVRTIADICIDTTTTHLHQLRDLMRQRVDRRPVETLSVLFQSFGYKQGVPPDADMVFDVRCLPNPYWEPGLRNRTGLDVEVRHFLDAEPEASEMIGSLTGFLERWVPSFEAENRAYLNVAVGCTGGQHRSVYVVERLGEQFQGRQLKVMIRHREIAGTPAR